MNCDKNNTHLVNHNRESEMIDRPNLEDAVFCIVDEDVGTVMSSNKELVDVRKGDGYLFRYKQVRQLVQDGKIRLV